MPADPNGKGPLVPVADHDMEVAVETLLKKRRHALKLPEIPHTVYRPKGKTGRHGRHGEQVRDAGIRHHSRVATGGGAVLTEQDD